jgi:hypothetical protein
MSDEIEIKCGACNGTGFQVVMQPTSQAAGSGPNRLTSQLPSSWRRYSPGLSSTCWIRNCGPECLYWRGSIICFFEYPRVLVPEIRQADRARQRQSAAYPARCRRLRPCALATREQTRALADRHGLPPLGCRKARAAHDGENCHDESAGQWKSAPERAPEISKDYTTPESCAVEIGRQSRSKLE